MLAEVLHVHRGKYIFNTNILMVSCHNLIPIHSCSEHGHITESIVLKGDVEVKSSN